MSQLTDAEQQRAVDLVDKMETTIREFFAPGQIDLQVAIRSTLLVLTFMGRDGGADADTFTQDCSRIIRSIMNGEHLDGTSTPH